MTDLIRSIVAAKFAATPTQIENLARNVVDGVASAGTYLQTLIAATQTEISKPSDIRRPKAQRTQLAAFERAYAPSLEAVQRGVVARGEELSGKEMSSRCGFARTSGSALRKYIEGGGDVRVLEPGKVSRRMLRPEGQAAPAGTSKAEGAVLTAVARVERVADRAARVVGASAARKLLEAAIEKLSAKLDAMADGNTAPRASAVRTRRAAEQMQMGAQ